MHLPPELWLQTMSWLPIAQKKTLLQVSRFLRDIALPLVFSSVKVHLLAGREVLEMLDTKNKAFALEVENKLMRRSWEILDRIIEDAQFARVVKDITVVTCTDSKAIFEQLTLSKALSTLKNLRTLRCYGANTALIEAVVRAVPPTVQHILYPTSVSLDVLDKLPDLKQFEHRNILYDFSQDGAADFLYPPEFHPKPIIGLRFIPSVHNRLHVLSINATWVDQIPVWVYGNLTVLEIIAEDFIDPINIDFICHQCLLLEDFTLVGYIHPVTCLSLPDDPTLLPKLHSFRLSCEPAPFNEAFTDDQSAAVSAFVTAHINLRRLYLRFPDAAWSSFYYLLPNIQELPNLEVFGFHTGIDELIDDSVELLAENLPMGLKALHLATSWESDSGSHIPFFMNTLSRMPRLSFLHLYATEAPLPFTAEGLVMKLSNLTMVGLTRALWDVDGIGPEMVLSKWPSWKTRFFSGSDFHDPDNAWLYKYHWGDLRGVMDPWEELLSDL